MAVPPSRSLPTEILLITLAALLAGIFEAALITTHRVAGVDPFLYVPLQVWFFVPLAWIGIAAILAIPAYLISRQQGAVIVLCAIAAIFVGCRIALVSRKWGLCVLVAIFLGLLWMTRRMRLPRLRRSVVLITSVFLAVACLGAAIPHRS